MTPVRQIDQLAALYLRRLRAAEERRTVQELRRNAAAAAVEAADRILLAFERDQAECESRFLGFVLGRSLPISLWNDRRDGLLSADYERSRNEEVRGEALQAKDEAVAELRLRQTDEAACRRDHDKLVEVRARLRRQANRRSEASREAEQDDAGTAHWKGHAAWR